MPTDSNEYPISSSTAMSTLSTTTTTLPTMTTSISHHHHHPDTRPNSPSLNPTRQINKLKRFLSTLYHFGSDISNEIGEHVRALILALVNNALSVDEFHSKVQAATNFPLRPFALPFLKTTLPLLQKDLSQLAQQSKQSPSQFLAQHEDLILLPRDTPERASSPAASNSKEHINENGKRKLPDDMPELEERPYATTRSLTSLNPNNSHRRIFIPTGINNNLSTSTSIRRDIREKERAFTAYLREFGTDLKGMSSKNLEDDWKNAESMLNCILEMVTKAKRVLFVLQQKDSHLRRLIETNDMEWRRRHADLLTQTNDRINDVRRKAEEAVLEVKRQSLIDLQKAVSQTEQKSNEILLREREQYQRLNQESKAQTFEEVYALLNRQEDGSEQCWHCGRKAIETCSGCNIARYCGQYCQHRDWELHQKFCGPDFKRKFNDNPQIYRHSLSKLHRNTSSHQLKETSPISITRRISETKSATPHLSVSLSPNVETTAVDNGDDDVNQSQAEKEDVLTVKNENV